MYEDQQQEPVGSEGSVSDEGPVGSEGPVSDEGPVAVRDQLDYTASWLIRNSRNEWHVGVGITHVRTCTHRHRHVNEWSMDMQLL